MMHYVLLAGGLGNQLFQYSAAVSLGASKVVFVDFIGNKRRDQAGKPEILSLDLTIPIDFIEILGPHHILRKYFLWLLGSTARPHSYRYRLATSTILQIVTSLTIKYFTQLDVCIVIEDRLNRKVRLIESSQSVFLIGYFQSIENAMSIERNIKHVKLNEPSRDFVNYLQKIDRGQIIGLHVRQGDYVNHPTFGNLSTKYFKEALDEIWTSGKEVIIFSDSNVSAQKYVPKAILPVTTICPSTFTGLEVLLLMSRCRDLIMSNSSLSWWAAFIGQKFGNHAYAPEPWFKSEVQSSNFYHSKWDRRSGEFI
jgi:hypothetical protein